jgi:hypothetical protein
VFYNAFLRVPYLAAILYDPLGGTLLAHEDGMIERVEVEIAGKLFSGSFEDRNGVVTVTTANHRKSTQRGGSRLKSLMRCYCGRSLSRIEALGMISGAGCKI